MSDIHKSTRLGDLLVERGTLTRHQLMRAIETQQERLFKAQHDEDDGSHKELGEILIELGFINRSQLDSGLTWQRKLRKTTLVMAFIAPLLTAACGGGRPDLPAIATIPNLMRSVRNPLNRPTPPPNPAYNLPRHPASNPCLRRLKPLRHRLR